MKTGVERARSTQSPMPEIVVSPKMLVPICLLCSTYETSAENDEGSVMWFIC